MAAMDELNAVRHQSTPREQALVRRLGRRFVPAWGFVAYGVLYLFVAFTVAMTMFVGALLGVGDRFGRPVPAWYQGLLVGVALVCFVISWWPFARWIGKRRGEAYRLFRDGRLLEASVVSVDRLTVSGTTVTRATVRFEVEQSVKDAVVSIAGAPAAIVPGAMLPFLYEPGCRYSAAFVDGRAVAAS